MPLPSLLSHWRAEPGVGGNVTEWRTLPPTPARTEPFPPDLNRVLIQALYERGIHSLYIHQSQAWKYTQAGQNVVVVTGTASGKTLCYNLPVLDRLLHNPQARALYLFPTKALAQDQLAGLHNLCDSLPTTATLTTSVYDGDTPSSARPAIRSKARLVISNPDMLHTGILAHHTSWAEFFKNLEYVVIDEMHTYRGVFGSHVANVLRRLKRVTRHYGSTPQFVLTSATIANPEQLAEWLIEEPVTLVDEDGSARGVRHFLIYNPPVVDKELGIRRSVLQESVRLAEYLLAQEVQTIVFGRTRRSVELILSYLRERTQAVFSEAGKPGPQKAIRGYRSGYLPGQRREIERGLKLGEVRAVIATTALELGIDIGGMGAAVLAGYPGTIAATWQQAGRAGRGEDASLAVLVTSANPLDQFLAHHPEYFFGRTPEQALINPDNLLILLGHLRCAAFELPFTEGEAFGRVEAARVLEFLEYLQQEGLLHHSGNRYFWMADRYPAEGVSLRSTSPDPVVLQAPSGEDWTTIGQVDLPSASWLVHPGAVYMHEAAAFVVEQLDLEAKVARLKPVEADYYTEPRSQTTVQLVEKMDEGIVTGGTRAHGELIVTTQVTGFRKVKMYTHETLGLGEVSLPPSELMTTGYWLALSDDTVRELQDLGLWTNAPNDYGPHWQLIRAQVRERDEYRCQACGLLEADREHDVHHKQPFRTFAKEGIAGPVHERANQLSNLITLCPTCHHRVETAVRVRSGLSGLAFALGNLAPLFLMCDTRDLGVHSDPEAAVSEGKPAVVIYDQAPAGLGFSQRLYEIHDELMKRAYELVSACACSDGCPSCTGPGGENGAGGKPETLAILKILRGMK